MDLIAIKIETNEKAWPDITLDRLGKECILSVSSFGNEHFVDGYLDRVRPFAVLGTCVHVVGKHDLMKHGGVETECYRVDRQINEAIAAGHNIKYVYLDFEQTRIGDPKYNYEPTQKTHFCKQTNILLNSIRANLKSRNIKAKIILYAAGMAYSGMDVYWTGFEDVDVYSCECYWPERYNELMPKILRGTTAFGETIPTITINGGWKGTDPDVREWVYNRHYDVVGNVVPQEYDISLECSLNAGLILKPYQLGAIALWGCIPGYEADVETPWDRHLQSFKKGLGI